MVTKQNRGWYQKIAGAPIRRPPEAKQIAVPGGRRNAAPAVVCSNLCRYLLLFFLVRKINHIFNKVCHNRMKPGCVIRGNDRLARPGLNFLTSVSSVVVASASMFRANSSVLMLSLRFSFFSPFKSL